MAELFFPQLASGAVAQYPVVKAARNRTVKNAMADGTVWRYPDAGAQRQMWELQFADLDETDASRFEDFFNACAGRLHAFTFIDPTENMLVSSTSMQAAAWRSSPSLSIEPGAPDPRGGAAAFTITNGGQTDADLTQTLSVPSGFQYCFSIWLSSLSPDSLRLLRQGTNAFEVTSAITWAHWTRAVSSGRLNDTGASFTTGLRLAPGQQVIVYGPQLEPQVIPSSYRPTNQSGGVYQNAFVPCRNRRKESGERLDNQIEKQY